jgi:hypothetical protein
MGETGDNKIQAEVYMNDQRWWRERKEVEGGGERGKYASVATDQSDLKSH